jgi:class 3 adenylate cyclase
MKCPNCQSGVDPLDKFCRDCGHDLRQEGGALFRGFGSPRSYTPKHLTDRILTTRSSVEGERKFVTVLFTDVAGYTAMASRLDPERVHQIMDGCFKILMEKIHHYEGTINQFTGDGLMALFGAPLAHEDHAQSACLAALEIREALVAYGKDLKSQFGIDFKMRVGLNSGPVVVGSIGDDLRMDYTAVGDTTNLAFRIQSHAKPGSILVSHNTYRMVKEALDLSPLGYVSLKGKEEPVPLYALSPMRRVQRPRPGRERQIYSEMVGRDGELVKLELQLMKLIVGEGSVVNIIGEAGIGKSRLVAEWMKHEAMKRVTLLEGRAIPIGRNLSYHPITDLLKQWAQIRHDDAESVAYSKLESALKRLFPDHFQDHVPFLAAIMGVHLPDGYADRVRGIEGEALERLILNALRELLIRASRMTPLVISVEDLHWIDTSSLELMESLFNLSATHRILFINLFRPGFKDTGDRVVNTLKHRQAVSSVDIRLKPLDVQNSVRLARNMLDGGVFSGGLAKQIANRSGGNPYFIEEIARSLIEENEHLLDRDVSGTGIKAERLIPVTVSDVLMARIDRLEEETRELVKIASIVGRSFFDRIIKDVASATPDMERRLAYLTDIQIIKKYERLGEPEYSFNHALTQEAVYSSILPLKRKELHLRVAHSIEKLFSNKLNAFYGILSYHFNQGEDMDRAEAYMLEAGDEAMKMSASHEALNYYKSAMELYIHKVGDAVDIDKIAGLEENIAIAFFNKGYFVEAVNYFERSLKNRGVKMRSNPVFLAVEFVFNIGSILGTLYLPRITTKRVPSELDARTVRLKFKLGLSLSYVDIRRVLVDNIRNIADCFKYDIRKSPIYVDALVGGSALFAIGGISFGVSKRILEYVKENLSDECGEASLPSNFYMFTESLVHCLIGEWHRDVDVEYVKNTLKVGDVSSASGYLVWLGYSKVEVGDQGGIRTIIDTLYDIGNSYNFEHAKLDYYFLSSKLAMKKNEINKAVEWVDEGILVLDKIGLEMRKVEFLGLKARILCLQQDLDAAAEIIREAERVIVAIGKLTILPNYYSEYLIGRLRYDLGMLERAIASEGRPGRSEGLVSIKASSKDTVRICARHFKRRTAVDRTEAYRLIGRYFWFVNKRKKALKWWSRSITEGQRLGAEPEISETCREIASRVNEMTGQRIELNHLSGKECLEKVKSVLKN